MCVGLDWFPLIGNVWAASLLCRRFLDNLLQLQIELEPVAQTVEGGAQIQQQVNVECENDFTEQPVLDIAFT
jgi:hypothetical protein